MEQIDYDIDDFITYCEVKNLSKFHEYRDYVIAQLIFDTGMRIVTVK